MRRTKAFTLIELLVVVAIVALLMAILLPTLQRVQLQAKSVRCQSILCQEGRYWWTMAAEDGSVVGQIPYGNRPMISREQDAMLCPMATRILWETEEDAVRNLPAYDRGGKFAAWGCRSWKGEPGPRGSYGCNQYPTQPYTGGPLFGGGNWLRHWRPGQAEGRADVPLLLDSRYRNVSPRDDDKPPPEDDVWVPDSGMSDVCIDRHQGGVNSLFCDSSVRKVGLKELWTLKWHKQFNTHGPWTKAGGVKPEEWPQLDEKIQGLLNLRGENRYAQN